VRDRRLVVRVQRFGLHIEWSPRIRLRELLASGGVRRGAARDPDGHADPDTDADRYTDSTLARRRDISRSPPPVFEGYGEPLAERPARW
jgi:hypothetical protein